MNVALKIALIKKLIATITALIALLSAQPVKLGGIGDLATTTAVAIVDVPLTIVGYIGVNYFQDLTTGKIIQTTTTEAGYDALGKVNAINPTYPNARWLYSVKRGLTQ